MKNCYITIKNVEGQTLIDVKGDSDQLSSSIANILVFEEPIRRIFMAAIIKSLQVLDMENYMELVDSLLAINNDKG